MCSLCPGSESADPVFSKLEEAYNLVQSQSAVNYTAVDTTSVDLPALTQNGAFVVHRGPAHPAHHAVMPSTVKGVKHRHVCSLTGGTIFSFISTQCNNLPLHHTWKAGITFGHI